VKRARLAASVVHHGVSTTAQLDFPVLPRQIPAVALHPRRPSHASEPYFSRVAVPELLLAALFPLLTGRR
jgi:hypothetical protein